MANIINPLKQKSFARNCLSTIWAPTGGVSLTKSNKREIHYDSSALLARAGFIRQSGSGIFHLLPLGLRVQQKIEHLIDKHMNTLGASKISLSSITSEALWTKSGRFNGENPEMYRLAGQKGPTGQLLSPTHEEEITELVKSAVQSYKQLPLRLYQISRKYRNELRPRQGLLRAREFLMKDLYTFDIDEPSALETYRKVVSAYRAFFNELKIPYLVAEADSGAMGGDLSHEFHFVSDAGEDTIFNCSACNYVVNEELLGTSPRSNACPKCTEGELRTQRAIELGHTFHLGTRYSKPLEAHVAVAPAAAKDLMLGSEHTGKEIRVPMQMGCHGIGVSRLIGAVPSILADDKGLNWPHKIAPFDVVIICRDGLSSDAYKAYDALASVQTPSGLPGQGLDVVLDDRQLPFAWKLHDADLIGYPVIVNLGGSRDGKQRSGLPHQRRYEVQCRRLDGLRQSVSEEDFPLFVESLLARL